MIFYFSGTGNSRYVAEQMAKATKEDMVFMSKQTMEKMPTYHLKEGERIGFVFPVYCYGVPKLVKQFIERLVISETNGHYAYAVATYGGSCGNTMKQIGALLEKKQIPLTGRFGVKMVDNFILMYDLRSKQKREQIIAEAKKEVAWIGEEVRNRNNKDKYVKGAIAPLSQLLQAGYQQLDHSRKFYATQACTQCGLCGRTCPAEVITVTKEGPRWQGDCAGCLKCLHTCPTQAIQWGNGTKKRGRYTFPGEVE